MFYKTMKKMGILLLLLTILISDKGWAGQFISKDYDVPYIKLGFGAEYMGLATISNDIKQIIKGDMGSMDTAFDFAFALQVGFRLKFVRLGFLYQYTTLVDISEGLSCHKLYADIITALRFWRIEIPIRFAVGWTGLSGDKVLSGIGLKFGTGIDFDIIRLISIGIFFDGDLQFFYSDGFGAAYGFTFGGRIGFHI